LKINYLWRNDHPNSGGGSRLSALSLIAMAGIHFYLVFRGIGGLLGFLFVLNAIGGLVMAVANGRGRASVRYSWPRSRACF